MISIQHLTRRYGSLVAVDDVSTEIQRGEVVGLLGHNGAGKTTVMRILTGFLDPTSGTAKVGGKDVVTDRIDVQRQIGYLPENAPLYGEMLVQEYLLMMAELRGLEGAEARRAIGRAVEATGLEERVTQPIGTLSKGFRQRVGLAQAILHRPDVLVLDEPTNGLDPMQIHAIRDLIRRLGEDATIILSTHILQEIEAVCDRVLVMIQGKLAADAPLDEILTSNQMRVRLAPGATGVAERLARIEGVGGVTPVDGAAASSDGSEWLVDVDPGARVTQAIIDAGRDAGWTFEAIAPEHRSLEMVFKQLQEEHIKEELGANA